MDTYQVHEVIVTLRQLMAIAETHAMWTGDEGRKVRKIIDSAQVTVDRLNKNREG